MTGLHVEQRGNDGAPLLFLHGVGGDHRCFGPQLELLSDSYRVLAADLPGYGGSDRLAHMDFPGLARAVSGWVKDNEPEGIHLIGHSFGGMVAQQIAADNPEALLSLTLSGTSPAFGRKEGDFQKKFVADRTRPLDEGKSLRDIAKRLVPGLLGKDIPLGTADIMIETMAAIEPETYRQAVSCIVTFDLRAELPNIAVPTLCIAGGEDKTAPPGMMMRMAEKIPGSTFIELPGAGHLANLEQPEAFNDALVAFLKKI